MGYFSDWIAFLLGGTTTETGSILASGGGISVNHAIGVLVRMWEMRDFWYIVFFLVLVIVRYKAKQSIVPVCSRHCDEGSNPVLLNPFLYLLCKVTPFWVHRFYKFEFLFSTSSFELLFSHNCRFYIFEIFIVHTEFAVIFFGKTFCESLFVFWNSSE